MIRSVLLPIALASLLLGAAAAPALAEGEDQGFSFHPSVEAALLYDDEPDLSKPGTNARDFGFRLVPRVEVAYRTPEVAVGADVGVDLRRYFQTGRRADEFVRAVAFAEGHLLPGLTARVANAYAPHYQQLGLPEDHGANLLQANRLEGELRYWNELGRDFEFEVGGGASYFRTESFAAGIPSVGGAVDPSFRADFWQLAGLTQLRHSASRYASLGLVGQVGYREYDDGARADHTNVAVLAGLRTERFETIEIELLGGYGVIFFDGLSDTHQPIWRASLRHQLPYDFAWSALVANRFRSNLAGNEVFEAAAELGLEKQWTERLDSSVTVFAARFEDRAAPSNLYGGVEAEIGFDLAEFARVSLGYRHWRNRGNLGVDDMTQNWVTFQIAVRL